MAADHAGQGQLDEAFLRALYEGSDLLGKGHLEEAREALQQAVDLRPADPKAQNLLGLACFKLGDHKRALEIYTRLIDDNPADATLRVNLGLVYLKSGRYEDAIRELATATDLNPDHKRANNYLGLAYARVGDYAQARECFASAGSDQMVEKMDRALAGEPFDGVAALGSAGPDAPPPAEAEAPAAEASEPPEAAPAALEPADEPEQEPEPPVEAMPAEDEYLDPFGEPMPEPEEAAPEAPAEATPPAAFAEATIEEPVLSPEHFAAPPQPAPAPRWRGAKPFLEAVKAASLAGAPAAPFAVSDDVVALRVEGELFSRVRGLLAAEGELSFTPEVKRFRGRATDKPFGEGEERVLRIAGEGRLFVAARGRTFTAFELERTDGFFQEEKVFAFEESVAYENGRVPSSVSPDLNLVHLRGTGVVLVATAGPVLSLRVEPERPVRLPLGRLVAWNGSLTPRLLAFADEGGVDDGPLVGVELAGEGVVLLALPPED